MRLISLILLLVSFQKVSSQQIADPSFHPQFQSEYQSNMGPVVFIDEGHFNFHTKEGRYKPFANLLERDGYVVNSYEGEFTRSGLDKGRILVISNALHESNESDWQLPNPSAFTDEEINIVKEWVEDGGSLFLIADHMPLAGAATKLGQVFGFEFTNGFAFSPSRRPPDVFSREGGGIVESIITNGRNAGEKVIEVASFTGQAFELPKDATPILMLDDRFVNYLPSKAWVFDEDTPKHELDGWCQGAYQEFGKGRIVVFGEAAMFSAQLAGEEKRKMGMNNTKSKDNYQLLLNIIHWLDNRY